jgi:hypothetical protein
VALDVPGRFDPRWCETGEVELVKKHTVCGLNLRAPPLRIGVWIGCALAKTLFRVVELLDETGVGCMVKSKLFLREESRQLAMRQRHRRSRLEPGMTDE